MKFFVLLLSIEFLLLGRSECLQASQANKRLPKFLFSVFSKTNAQEAECTRKGGSLINGECYILIRTPFTNFAAARAACQATGGDVWTPDTNDPFLPSKLVLKFPQIFRAIRRAVWIGATNAANVVTDINGKDISGDYMVGPSRVPLLGPPFSGPCNRLAFESINTWVPPVPCDDPLNLGGWEVVCEIPIVATNTNKLLNLLGG